MNVVERPGGGFLLVVEYQAEHLWLQHAKKAPNVPLGKTVKARLKQFSVMNKLKKRALRFFLICQVIAKHLSVEEVADIKETFDMMDTKQRGKITLEELKAGLQKLGQQIPDVDLQILVGAAAGGGDGDRALNYGEFVAVLAHLRKMANDEHLHKAFAFFLVHLRKMANDEHLHKAFAFLDINKSGEEVINAIMHDVDTNKDGRISYEEFDAMMKAGTGWRKASRRYSRERFNSLSMKLIQVLSTLNCTDLY
ncbi:hypothetical protein J1N35_019050 [Gossypium stocksii]|uniref:EF-hand domain-containing protein n=1 Tax=Gossypium stocksii TaxID=47602 RepID=A0A9D4A785_9ROSI|nr:hypothetical protein J1N35_019050 [Gossypium stocksii]